MENIFLDLNKAVELKARILSEGICYSDSFFDWFSKSSDERFLAKRRVYGNSDDFQYGSMNIPQEIVFEPYDIVANAMVRINSDLLVDITADGPVITDKKTNESYSISFTKEPVFYGETVTENVKADNVITYLFGHTFGIFESTQCYLANKEEACKFCSIRANKYRPKDILNIVDVSTVLSCLDVIFRKDLNVTVNNIFISGGNIYNDVNKNFKHYSSLAVEVAKLIEKYSLNISVTLSVFPPQDLSLVDMLHGYNINLMVSTEVFDPHLYDIICPGKSKILSKSHLESYLCSAVRALGHNRVFSFAIHGLEPLESLLHGIEKYAEMGVCTIVHVLRKEPGTDIGKCDVYVPTFEEVVNVAKYTQDIYSRYGFDSSVAYGGRSSLDKEASLGLIK